MLTSRQGQSCHFKSFQALLDGKSCLPLSSMQLSQPELKLVKGENKRGDANRTEEAALAYTDKWATLHRHQVMSAQHLCWNLGAGGGQELHQSFEKKVYLNRSVTFEVCCVCLWKRKVGERWCCGSTRAVQLAESERLAPLPSSSGNRPPEVQMSERGESLLFCLSAMQWVSGICWVTQ